MQHKFVFELGWRACFRHVWQHRGDGILHALHEGRLPGAAYARELPAGIRQACTGVPVVDEAVRALFATGTLHNPARMWLASYVVHRRKVHWRAGADWLYRHLLDGDLASNHLKLAVGGRHRQPQALPPQCRQRGPSCSCAVAQPGQRDRRVLRGAGPHGAAATGLVRRARGWPAGGRTRAGGRAACPDRCIRPRSRRRERPRRLARPSLAPRSPAGHLDAGHGGGRRLRRHFHAAWPWNERRWRFAGGSMAEWAALRWHGDAASLGAAPGSSTS